MIFYFSATGNSKYAAIKLSEETGEEIVSIVDLMKERQFESGIPEGERIGFITPTYFLGLPTVVNEFFENLILKTGGNNYVYHVSTFGTTTGQTGKIVEDYLGKKGITLHGKFSVQMNDTWTPIFNLTDKEKVKRNNERAEIQLNDLLKKVKSNVIGDFIQRKVPKLAVNIYYPTYEKKRKTSYFQVEKTCISCGLCVRQCPVQGIEIQDKKPVWVKEKCTLCLGCLHRCPKFSIQYGKNTKKHGQFTNPNVKL